MDKVVVNAGLGKGAQLGTGGFAANKETAMTNFVAALAQTEAAMEIFRAQQAGHLVMVSSMSAMRGMPKTHDDVRRHQGRRGPPRRGHPHRAHGRPLGKTVKVTVLYPGYIASEMNDGVEGSTPLMVSTEKGVRPWSPPSRSRWPTPASRRCPGRCWPR